MHQKNCSAVTNLFVEIKACGYIVMKHCHQGIYPVYCPDSAKQDLYSIKEKSEKNVEKTELSNSSGSIKRTGKIVMIRQLDGVYRLDHAVTATQKTILDAFGLNEGNVRYQAKRNRKNLTEQVRKTKEKRDGKNEKKQRTDPGIQD